MVNAVVRAGPEPQCALQDSRAHSLMPSTRNVFLLEFREKCTLEVFISLFFVHMYAVESVLS